MGRINQKTDRVYPIDYMFKKVEELTNLLEGDIIDHAEQLESHTSQLAKNATDNEEKRELLGWELQNKVREIKPLVTFVDDDAFPAVLTKLKPLSETYGIPFVVAAISGRVDKETFSLTSAQLRDLQAMGWEISSHTHTHQSMTNMTDEQQEYEMKTSKEILTGMGLKITTICYPFGGRNDNTHKFVRKYYRAGRRTDDLGRMNLTPLETYDMVVTPLGAFPDTMSNPPYPTNSLDYYKYQVDQAVTKNAWLIFMTHVADAQHDATQQSYLEQTIQYVQSKGIEVVTLDEGLNRRGNIVDVGRYLYKDYTKSHFVLSADGKLSSELRQTNKILTDGSIVNTTAPKDIPRKHTIVSDVAFSQATGMPEGNSGVLITTHHRAYDSETIATGFVRQQYRVASSNHVYERYSIDDTTWSAWERINILRMLTQNSVTVASVLSAFPKNTISKCIINAAASNPEPWVTGELTTNRAAGYDFVAMQEFRPENTNNIYVRNWVSSAWSPWKRITSRSATTTDRNAANFPKNKGDSVFDETLGKPIWYNGTAWVDSTGTTV